MAVDKTYKNGGSGKGQAIRMGVDLNKFGSNLDKTHGTRKLNCLDCVFYISISIIDVVNCIDGKKNKGLKSCSDFVKE